MGVYPIVLIRAKFSKKKNETVNVQARLYNEYHRRKTSKNPLEN